MSKARDIADLGSNDVLETTSTGVDVTGTVTADGLTVDDGEILVRGLNSTVNDNVPTIRFDDTDASQASGQKAGQILFESSDASPNANGVYAYINAQATDTSGTGNIYFGTGVTNSAVDRMRIANNGDVSFFEDTGTTAKMVWDASAEKLTIDGDSSATDLATSVTNSVLELNGNSPGGSAALFFSKAASGGGSFIQASNSSGTTAYDIGLNAFGGNVGIGTASPSRPLDVYGGTIAVTSTSAFAGLQITSANNSFAYVNFGDSDDSNIGQINYNHTDNSMLFVTNNTERARIDSSGNLLVGTTSAPTGSMVNVNGLITGGFGARTTSGNTDWNHIDNARSGSGKTLLLGNHSNGPGPSSYFHSFCFEYSTKGGSGNLTQWAIGYNVNQMYQRYRYGNYWTAWSQIL